MSFISQRRRDCMRTNYDQELISLCPHLGQRMSSNHFTVVFRPLFCYISITYSSAKQRFTYLCSTALHAGKELFLHVLYDIHGYIDKLYEN